MSYTYNSFINADRVLRYKASTGQYTDVSGQTAFDYFDDAIAAGDALYFGRSYYPFDDLRFFVGTPLAATSITLIWEYQAGGANPGNWLPLSVTDNTNSFQNSGQNDVLFVPPLDWYWQYWGGFAPLGIRDTQWIRCRVSAVTSPSEGGAQSTQQVQYGDNTVHLSGGSVGSRNTMAGAYSQDQANGWGVISRLGNGDAGYIYVVNASVQDDAGSYNEFIDDVIYLDGANKHLTLQNDNVFGAGSGDRPDRGCLFKLAITCQNGTYFDIDTGGNAAYGVRVQIYLAHSSWTGGSQVFLRGTKFAGLVYEAVGFGGDSGPKVNLGDNCTFKRCSFSGAWRNSTLQATTVLDDCKYYVTSYQQISGYIYFAATNTITEVDALDSGGDRHIHIRGGIDVYLHNCLGFTEPNIFHNAGGATSRQHTQWGFDLTVQDTAGVGLAGATVRITDADGTEIFNDVTDSNGNIPTQWLTQTLYYDNSSDYFWALANVSETKTPHTITITKSGYRQNTMILTMDRKRDEIAVLVASLPIVEGAITADISQDAVTGNVVQDAIIGDIVQDVVTGDVGQQDTITSNIVQDTVTGNVTD